MRARLTLCLVAFGMVGAAAGGIPGGSALLETLAYLLPLLLLVLPLLFGVYVGEERLLRPHAARRPRRTAVRAGAPVQPVLAALRGGLLIATSRAERPPPAFTSA